MADDNIRRGYQGSDDLGALREFLIASGISDQELSARVYSAMLELNRAIQCADVMGISVKFYPLIHIWMNSSMFALHVTKDGKDIDPLGEFYDEAQSDS